MNKRQLKKYMKFRIDPVKEFGIVAGRLIQKYIDIISQEERSAKRQGRKPSWLKCTK